MPSESVPSLPTIAFNKRRVPNRRRSSPADQINHPAETSQPYCPRLLLRKSSSAISGFRSRCGRERHSDCARMDLRFGTFQSAGLSLLDSTRLDRGASDPGPMLWPERSRSRVIFQEVFLRSNRTLSGHFTGPDGAPECPPDRPWEAPGASVPPPSSKLGCRPPGPARPPQPERRQGARRQAACAIRTR